jgi:hypothetical protein
VEQPSYSVTTDNTVTLVCTVSSSLPINDVQWQRNIGGSITTITSNTTTSKYSGSTTTTPFLTIFSASSSDAGTYTCFASNSVGTGQSTTTTLSVTESRLTSIFALHNGLSYFYTSVPNILYFISAWMLQLKLKQVMHNTKKITNFISVHFISNKHVFF